MNLFDIMGPIMVGPSSSHTAGAARIGRITRRLLGEPPVSAQLLLHGSFAATGAGHGTDRALVAGLLATVLALLFESFTFSDILAAWVPLLYTGIISSGVGYTLQILGQRTVNPTVASLILSLESVFAVLAGWVLLGQPLSPRELVGCALVFAAVVLAQLPRKKPKVQSE